MGRPRTFDEAQVVRAATELFGRRGYDALSVDILVTELGVSRASLYKLYGSKHGLMTAALDALLIRARAGEATDADRDLVVVALTELAPADPALRATVAEAVRWCFADSALLLGSHVLSRAGLGRDAAAPLHTTPREDQS